MKKIFLNLFVFTLAILTVASSYVLSFATADTQVPTNPANLRAIEITDTMVRLRWDESKDNVSIKGYEIYMNNSKIGVVTFAGAKINQLKEKTTYTFKVLAYDAAGNKSLFSNQLTFTTGSATNTAINPPTGSATNAAIHPPTELKTVEVDETFLRISWKPSSSTSVAQYAIYLNDKQIGKVTSPRAKISNLKLNTTYHVKVVALDAKGNSSVPSNTLSIKTLATPNTNLTAPLNLNLVEVTRDMIRVKWDPGTSSKGVTGYDVYLNGERLGSVTLTAAKISNLESNKEYKIKVVALDAYKNLSPASATLSVKTTTVK
jgi:chitodextrinase